jgi:hypothetical protein
MRFLLRPLCAGLVLAGLALGCSGNPPPNSNAPSGQGTPVADTAGPTKGKDDKGLYKPPQPPPPPPPPKDKPPK